MSELLLDPLAADPPRRAPHESLQDALMESRRRWRHFVHLAADLAFETDATGCFSFLLPDSVLGWSAGSLIGQPAAHLLGDDEAGTVFNPLNPALDVTKHRTWLKRADGTLAMVAVSATPLRDDAGKVIGTRGVGVDMTDFDAESAQIASRLRRGQVLHHILAQVTRETETDGMMDAALWGLIHALGAEGAAVIGAIAATPDLDVLHECGPGATDVRETAAPLIVEHRAEPSQAQSVDGRCILAMGCEIRSGLPAGLAIWRTAESRPWDHDDTSLVSAATCIVRMILDHESLQREITRQARTDPLTGLLNRRAFVEDMRRQIVRLDKDAEPGTLMFVDVDAFKTVNDRLGHAIGDQILIHLADMLRKLVRPFDLITRLGGDEFAVWLSGADHLTAAERADFLCRTAPQELRALLPEPFPQLGVSVGIATRQAGSHEEIESLTRRADMAMYEAKRSGRHHWRVSLREGD